MKLRVTKPRRNEVRQAKLGFIPIQALKSPEDEMIEVIDKQKLVVTRGMIDPKRDGLEDYYNF